MSVAWPAPKPVSHTRAPPCLRAAAATVRGSYACGSRRKETLRWALRVWASFADDEARRRVAGNRVAAKTARRRRARAFAAWAAYVRLLAGFEAATVAFAARRREAKLRLPARMAPYERLLGVEAKRVSIRAQRTRWGSCSSHGTICLNWRLLLLPSDLCDYVLVHELCHLRHLDHSAKFWSLVERVFPDYEERERRLESLQGSLAL